MNNIFTQAKWIWHNDYHVPNIYLSFLDEFNVETDTEHKIFISADTNYAIYLNDKFVDSGQFHDFPEYKVYDEIDITTYVMSGKNKLEILGYWQGEDSFQYRKEPAGIIFVVKNGNETILHSSKQTLVSLENAYVHGTEVEKVSPQLSYSFKYNVLNSNKNVYKNADIQPKSEVEKLYPRPIKKLDIYERESVYLTVNGTFTENESGNMNMAQKMQYSSLAFKEPNVKRKLPSKDGINFKADGNIFFIVDLNEENTGFLDLDIDLSEDCEILIGWGEHLEDLRVRTSIGPRCFTASYYGKKGRNKFLYPIKRLGLRYLQVHVYSSQFKLYYAGIRPTLYPLHKNKFKCADNLHNKIYDVSLRTLEMCMHEHYEDCPWREQALYSMDSRNQMLIGYYVFNEYDFAKASLKLFALSIRDDNFLDICSPARCAFTIPSFTAVFITQLYEYLEHSNDIEFAKETVNVAKRIADEFISRIDETGLIPRPDAMEYWNFYEWQDGLSSTIMGQNAEYAIYDAPINAFVSMGLRSLANIYKMLGDDDKHNYYIDIRDKLNAKINDVFWNDEKNVYASFYSKEEGLSHYCELTQSLIVFADGVSDDRLNKVLVHLTDDSLIPVTISHSIFKYDALLKQPEKYARFVFNQVAKLWGHMLYNGATTFWETIDGAAAFSNAGSLCHGWSAVPAYLYIKYALNLDPKLTGIYESKFDLPSNL